MELTVGSIVDGKVTGIMKFGAFVSLPDGKSGLVHISEIAYTYVSQVSDFLKVGQEVRVKIIGIDENGRINLSIKKTEEPPARPAPRRPFGSAPSIGAARAEPQTASFEDKLKQFMQESDSRLSGVRQYSEKSSRRRGGKGGGYGDYES